MPSVKSLKLANSENTSEDFARLKVALERSYLSKSIERKPFRSLRINFLNAYDVI
jgi:hypothetical protein